MRVLGCTGGIGSGKTYVATIFNKMGVPLYCSDQKTKELYNKDRQLREALAQLLGNDILDGQLVKTDVIARKIFGSPTLLKRVEEIVHPAVMRDFERWKERQAKESSAKFVILESALILQKPIVKAAVDKILVVSAPQELRIERVIKRDNTTREATLQRMANQLDDSTMRSIADFTIFADEKQPLLPQIINVCRAMNTL